MKSDSSTFYITLEETFGHCLILCAGVTFNNAEMSIKWRLTKNIFLRDQNLVPEFDWLVECNGIIYKPYMFQNYTNKNLH